MKATLNVFVQRKPYYFFKQKQNFTITNLKFTNKYSPNEDRAAQPELQSVQARRYIP